LLRIKSSSIQKSSKLLTKWRPMSVVVFASFFVAIFAMTPARASQPSCSAAIAGPALYVDLGKPFGNSNTSKAEESARLKQAESLDSGAIRQRQFMHGLFESKFQSLKTKLIERGDQIDHFELRRNALSLTAGATYSLTAVDDEGMWSMIGELTYIAEGDRYATVSFDIKITEKYRNLGASILLAAAALENNPQTEKLVSALQGINAEEFTDAREIGISPEEAVERTPAFRLRRSLGYVVDKAQSVLPDSPYAEVTLHAIRADLAIN
jgi:hypothetical protein